MLNYKFRRAQFQFLLEDWSNYKKLFYIFLIYCNEIKKKTSFTFAFVCILFGLKQEQKKKRFRKFERDFILKIIPRHTKCVIAPKYYKNKGNSQSKYSLEFVFTYDHKVSDTSNCKYESSSENFALPFS